MTAVEAVELILQTTAMGGRGEIFVLDMGEKVRITDIAQKLVKLSGLPLGNDIVIDYVGLPPWENPSEELWEDGEKLVSTGHEKIKRIPFRQGNDQSVGVAITQMRKMAARGDGDGLMRKLCDLVPPYEFPGKKQLLLSRPSSQPSASEQTASVFP